MSMILSISTLRGLVASALTLLVVAIWATPVMAVDLAWLRHEPGDLAVDHYGHDGGATVPEVADNQNTYGCCGGGGSIIGTAPLASGGYVVARNEIDVNNGDNLFDSFVHDNDLNIVASSNNTRGLNNSLFMGIIGLGNGNYVWGRAENSNNQADLYLHSGTTAAEITDHSNGRGLGALYLGMAPVAGGNFVWGRHDAGPNAMQWFLHDGNNLNMPELDDNTSNARGLGLGNLGVAGLANGNFVYGRDNAGSIEWFVNSGTTADELAADLKGRGVGLGVLDVIGLADGNFVYARNVNGAYDFALHSGTTAGELAFAGNVRGVGTFLGMVPLVDGSFVYAREDQGSIDLFQYSGTTLAEIGVLQGHRGVGAGGSLFDGIVGLVPEPSTAMMLLLVGIGWLARRRRQ